MSLTSISSNTVTTILSSTSNLTSIEEQIRLDRVALAKAEQSGDADALQSAQAQLQQDLQILAQERTAKSQKSDPEPTPKSKDESNSPVKDFKELADAIKSGDKSDALSILDKIQENMKTDTKDVFKELKEAVSSGDKAETQKSLVKLLQNIQDSGKLNGFGYSATTTDTGWKIDIVA